MGGYLSARRCGFRGFVVYGVVFGPRPGSLTGGGGELDRDGNVFARLGGITVPRSHKPVVDAKSGLLKQGVLYVCWVQYSPPAVLHTERTHVVRT